MRAGALRTLVNDTCMDLARGLHARFGTLSRTEVRDDLALAGKSGILSLHAHLHALTARSTRFECCVARVAANQMAKRPQKHLYKGVIHAVKRTERAVSCIPVYHPSEFAAASDSVGLLLK